MAKTYSGAVSFANAFSYSSAVPMDDRSVVSTYDDLMVAENWKKNGVYFAYKGMPVVVADTGKIYTFVAESATDETIVMSESWHCVSGDFGDSIDYVEMIIEANASRHYKLFYDVRCIGWLEIDGEEVELPVITKNRAASYFAALSTGRHVVRFRAKEGYMSEKPDTPWKEREALLGWCDDNRVTEVTLPEGWTVVNAKMFEGAYSLRRVNLPSTITEVRFGAFTRCTALEEIVLPPSVTTISSNMADNCPALKRIVLGGRDISVSGTLAKYCASLECVEFRAGGTVKFTGNDQTFISLPYLASFIVKGNLPTFVCNYPFFPLPNNLQNNFVGSSVSVDNRWLFTPDGGEDALRGTKWRDLIRYCDFKVTKALSYTLL